MEKYDSIELKSTGNDVPKVHATREIQDSGKMSPSELQDVTGKFHPDPNQHDRRDMERMGKKQELRV